MDRRAVGLHVSAVEDFLPTFIEGLGLTHPLTYIFLFLGASLLMIWRLEAMMDHGLEGTALGTLVMPYCSGLGNLIFVGVMAERGGAAKEVLTNSLVNNVTNLTLLLGLPALIWGLVVVGVPPGGRARKSGAGAGVLQQVNRLSLVLTLVAVMFFSGAVWALGLDGRLTRGDGFMLIGLFLFWQCFQVFDVLKYNVRQKRSFGLMFYADVATVLVGAYMLYVSIDWLVAWLEDRRGGFFSADNLGWLTGWLMVLPNGLLAMHWGRKRRADVVYSSQVGDGHICIPLCLGIFALYKPLPVSDFAEHGLWLLLGSAGAHILFLFSLGGLPRWAGGVLVAAYGWFLWNGLVA